MNNTISHLEALSTRTKQAVLVFVDLILIEFSLWLSFYLQYDFRVEMTATFMPLFILLPVITIYSFVRLGLYRAVMRYVGQKAFGQVIKGVGVSVAALFLLGKLFKPENFSDSQLIIYGALALSLIGSIRFVIRHLIDFSWGNNKGKCVAIYGAGSAGRQLLKMLKAGRDYRPVVFIDSSKKFQRREVDGVMVLDHRSETLRQQLDASGVEEIFLAIPSASRRRRMQILKSLEPLPYHVRSVPGVEEILSGTRIDQLQEIRIEDLLGRDSVPPRPELLDKCIKDKVVMVTGAGGSIGSELCRQIFPLQPRVLLLLEQSEYFLYKIESEFRSIIERNNLQVELIPLLADVCNEQQIKYYLETFSVDTIYHAAAYKHVPMVEHNIVAGIENNILGTYNIAMLAMSANVENFVLISTDKAVRPTNVMGASKRFAEMVLQGLAKLESSTNFCMVRFGNVLGSSGSVVPLFRKQITDGGPVTVTHEDITRYFMTIPEAAQLVIQAGAMSTGGDVFVLDMGKPVKIINLAKSMIHLMGLQARDDDHPDGDIEIKVVGLRPGEKLYEELLIGENVSGTSHPKIMRAEEIALSYEQMEECISSLRSLIQDHNIVAIRNQLLSHVNGYVPEKKIVDYGYSRQEAIALEVNLSQEKRIH
jgi:FlaA1/EpsC-like NDP-sugar epimerase